jgi:hypothetical protein
LTDREEGRDQFCVQSAGAVTSICDTQGAHS